MNSSACVLYVVTWLPDITMGSLLARRARPSSNVQFKVGQCLNLFVMGFAWLHLGRVVSIKYYGERECWGGEVFVLFSFVLTVKKLLIINQALGVCICVRAC